MRLSPGRSTIPIGDEAVSLELSNIQYLVMVKPPLILSGRNALLNAPQKTSSGSVLCGLPGIAPLKAGFHLGERLDELLSRLQDSRVQDEERDEGLHKRG